MAEMSTEPGDIVSGDVRFRPSDHSYLHIPTMTKLAPVSRVIDTVFATKSWEGAKTEVVDNARYRGQVIDRYMTEYVRSSKLTVEDDDPDIINRLTVAHRIWESEFHGLPAKTQKIVFNLKDGVAGTMDFWVDQRIIADLKVTYNVEKKWILQLGAYAEYAPEEPERAGIIHVSPKVYKTGGIWMEYDVAACRRYWRKAVEWWEESKSMKARK